MELENRNAVVIGSGSDATDRDSLTALADVAIAELGGVHVLVNTVSSPRSR